MYLVVCLCLCLNVFDVRIDEAHLGSESGSHFGSGLYLVQERAFPLSGS